MSLCLSGIFEKEIQWKCGKQSIPMLVIGDQKGMLSLHTILPLLCLSNDALTPMQALGFAQK